MIRPPRTDQNYVRSAAKSWLLRASCLSCCLLPTVSNVFAQAPAATLQTNDAQQLREIERRISSLTETLAQTQAALQQSQAELIKLRAEITTLHAQGQPTNADPGQSSASTTSALTEPASEATSSSVQAEIRSLHEQQEILQAEVKQHDQIKLETASKYNLTITGLVLFNAYSNAGVVDNAELPAFALPRNPGSSHGSVGASLRQTMFGAIATGPVIAGAQSYASINLDFFGGADTNNFGYTTLNGFVRMRDAQLGLAWSKSKLQAGYTSPLISPLSPASIATVAQPALSASGNLWTWSPQVQFQQDVAIQGRSRISFEAGLISPASPDYSSIQLDSPVQASRRPGVEGRIAFHAGDTTSPRPRSLALGVGAYTANQFYNSSTRIHSWAVTGDWQVPILKWLDLTGEVYRGRSLGGLGGGLYKDTFAGTDLVTGIARTVGVETAGGWTQLKLTANSRWEANTMFGLDGAFSSSYRSVVLPPSTSPYTLTARNRTIAGNLIFRPRSSLIFSPEYRRIQTWRYTGASYIANIFTLSAGYKF